MVQRTMRGRETGLNWVNVERFGVRPERSATWNHPRIQDALDAGEPIYLPGMYDVDPAVGLLVPAGTRLVGDGHATGLRVPDGHVGSGNLLRVTNADNVSLAEFRLDGNRAGKGDSSHNYGLFLDSCVNATVDRIWVSNWAGVGCQAYDCDSSTISRVVGVGNEYHGLECEQCRGCSFLGNTGSGNDRHGLFVSPGEVGGSGSLNNQIIGNSFHDNGQYGIGIGEDAGGLSAFLSTGNIVVGNDVRSNGDYGISVWKVNGNLIQANTISGNGKHGVQLYQAAHNQVVANVLAGNGDSGDNAWDEVVLEGHADDNARPSRNNQIVGNTIIAGTPARARYGVNEASAGDGPNTILDNTYVGTFGTATERIQHATTRRSSPAGVVRVYGSEFIDGGKGLDGGFGTLRLVNDGGEVQVVTTAASPITFWANGTNLLTLGADGAVGFFGSSGATRRTVTDHASLVAALADYGLVVDGN